MSTVTRHHSVARHSARALLQNHFRHIVSRSEPDHERLCDTFAVTFVSGSKTTFLDQPRQQPLGSARLVAMSYGQHESSGRRTMPICGITATADSDGLVTYRAESVRFLFDAALRPSLRRRPLALNPARDPVLTALAQRLDRTCASHVDRLKHLPAIPRLPKIWLGFAEQSPPNFADTKALRILAAAELDMPIDRLGSNGEIILDRFLRDLWQRQLLPPDDPRNQTGALLVNVEYCANAHGALRLYEDFSDLLGMPTWNPARQVEPTLLPNPAAQILERFGVQSCEQPITDEQLGAMELAMRQAIGVNVPLTQSEIYDAITSCHRPLQLWSPVLPQLRRLLDPMVSAGTTDNDLLVAAAIPNEPLIASGACRIQVLRRRSIGPAALAFTPTELNRRIQLNLAATRWDRERSCQNRQQ